MRSGWIDMAKVAASSAKDVQRRKENAGQAEAVHAAKPFNAKALLKRRYGPSALTARKLAKAREVDPVG
jgi:hypothetical protein